MKKVTTSMILAKKNVEKIVMITAYDALFANLFDEFVDIILVGDSLNMNFFAQNDTLNSTINQMIYHTKAVKNGSSRAFVVCDMPFGSYKDEKTALKNAIKIYKQSGADAIKLEGGKNKAHIIKALCDEGIAVMGHIGLRPQMVRLEGGYKIKGKNGSSKLLDDALAIEEAGAFSIVIEGTISNVASEITNSVKIPTIGIGSGANTDGQVLVFSDLLGFSDFRPKFAKQYLNIKNIVQNAVQTYANEVKNLTFPSQEFEYQITQNVKKLY